MRTSNKAMLFVFPVLLALIPSVYNYTGLPVFPFPIIWFVFGLLVIGFIEFYLFASLGLFGSYAIFFAVSVLGYWLTLIPTLRGDLKFSKTQFIVIIVTLLLNVIWAATNWENGFRYQGKLFTVTYIVANLAIGICLLSYFIYFRNRATFNKKVFLNGMTWLWLLCYSFPALGELP